MTVADPSRARSGGCFIQDTTHHQPKDLPPSSSVPGGRSEATRRTSGDFTQRMRALRRWGELTLFLGGWGLCACDRDSEARSSPPAEARATPFLASRLADATQPSSSRVIQAKASVGERGVSQEPGKDEHQIFHGADGAAPRAATEARDGWSESSSSPRAEAGRIRRFSASGTLRGQVRQVSEGSISLGGANGTAQTLRGTPFTLGKINRGDDVEVPYMWVGNRRWLQSPLAERPPLAAFAVRGEVLGPVTRLDRKRGLLGIGRLRLKAHPSDLRTIAIGQVLRVDFVEVDRKLWVHSAAPAWQQDD